MYVHEYNFHFSCLVSPPPLSISLSALGAVAPSVVLFPLSVASLQEEVVVEEEEEGNQVTQAHTATISKAYQANCSMHACPGKPILC